MRLLVLSINYAPEPSGFAPHITALGSHLVKNGAEVTVITGFPFAPRWKRYSTYTRRLFMRERIGGVDVLRVTHFIPRRPRSMLQRILLEGTYCVAAALAVCGLASQKWDAVFYIGAQPSIAMLARGIAAVKGIPYVIEITDLAAQAASDLGVVRSSLIRKVLLLFEHAAYRKAAGAMVLHPSYRDALVRQGFPGTRIRVIMSPVDLKVIRPLEGGGDFRSMVGLRPADFVVLHSGSMGIKQGLLNVVEAARLLRDHEVGVKWVLVGDGEERPVIRAAIERYGLAASVLLLPFRPEAEMSDMFAGADVLLLNQLQSQDKIMASKFLAYMAAGKAVLASVNASSPAAEVLDDSGGGVIVPAENPQALADAVQRLRSSPEQLEEMGRRNRSYAESHFEQGVILDSQERFLMEVGGAQAIVDR